MGPPYTSRRSLKGRSSPRGLRGVRVPIRKPQTFGVRKTVYADRNQVDVLEKGLKVLHEGGEDNQAAGQGCEGTELTSRKAPMKVAVRVRPLNARESTANAKEIIAVSGPNMLVFDPERQQDDFFFRNQKLRDMTARKYKNQNFAFDHVYDSTGTNDRIYEDIMKPLLNTLLSGFNCSVFAYGATGSGKTYTMLGSAGNPGLTFLTINDLYTRLDSMKEDYDTQVAISYFEVYNEQVKDLLNPNGRQLLIMEVGNGIEIKDLTVRLPTDINDLLEMLRQGNTHRSQHPTDHNAESSRSHAVLQVHIRIRERHKSNTSSSRTSKLVMVDLAGSEKGCATGFSGQRFREGSSINKSLLALGKVMEALAMGKKTFSFRDSKLTRILKDSLGGNCRTVMIANISPSETLYEDTLNTLRYAQKAKKISSSATKNIITVQSCLSEYTRVVDEMTVKIQTLERTLKEKEDETQQQLNERDERIRELEMRLAAAEANREDLKGMQALKEKLMEAENKLSECEKKYEYSQSVLITEVNATTQVIYEPNLEAVVGQSGINNEEEDDCTYVPEVYVNIPMMDEIEKIKDIEQYLESEMKLNVNVMPKLEKFLRDFRLKLDQLRKLRSLATSTGDQRYDKAVRKATTKLITMLNTAKSSFLEGQEHFKNALISVDPMLSNITECRITNSQLWKYKRNEVQLKIDSSERKALEQQVDHLTSQLVRKEDLLKDFAVLCNQMHNSLSHYGNLAPKMKDQYDKLVSSYCSPSLKFEENLKCPGKEGCEYFFDDYNPSLFTFGRQMEVSNYFADVIPRFKSLKVLVDDLPEIESPLDDVLISIEGIFSMIPDEKFPFDLELDGTNFMELDNLPNLEGSECSETFQEAISAINNAIDHGFNELSSSSTGENTKAVVNETITLDKCFDSTFTLGEEPPEVEVNENDDPLIQPGTSFGYMTSSNDSDFFRLNTLKDVAAKFSGRVGAKLTKSSPTFEAASSGGMSYIKSYVSPGISPTTTSSGSTSTGLALTSRRIPIPSGIPRSASPHRTYSVGVGATKPVSSTGKLPATKITPPQAKSPYAKSKKAALNHIRMARVGNQNRQLQQVSKPKSLHLPKSTLQRPPIPKSKLGGGES